MASATEPLDLPIWQSPSSLQGFFKGERAIQDICLKRQVGASMPLLAGRWKVTIVIETCAYELSACAWRILSLLVWVCSTDLSKRCIVLALHAKSHAETLSCQKRFGMHFLAPSVNTYPTDRSDIYLHPPVNSSLFGPSGFFNANGLCRGMSNWFLYLYFQTRPAFDNPVIHMRYVTRQFAHGAPPQAALLHLFNPHVRPRPVAAHLPSLQITEFFRRFSTNSSVTNQAIAAELNELDSGAYTVFSSRHQFNFIKIDDDLSFIFDPNYGCFILDSSLSLERVLPLCLSTHNYSRGEIVIDLVKPLRG